MIPFRYIKTEVTVAGMVLIIGHRGCRGLEPENTLRAFRRALQLGVDGVECDVRLCRSGEPVVIHDYRLERTTNGKGYVRAKTLAQLRQLNAGKGEKVPTLAEVIELVNGRAMLVIELKTVRAARPAAELLLRMVRNAKIRRGNFLVSSFRRNALRSFRSMDRHALLCLVSRKPPRQLARLNADVNLHSVHLLATSITRELVMRMHGLGLRVFGWTVNTPEQAKKMKALGVDGIFTDYPGYPKPS